MPLNPAIILGAQPAAIPTLPQLAQQRLTLASLADQQAMGRQQRELNDLKLAGLKRQEISAQALGQAYAGATTADANGVQTFDRAKLQQAVLSDPRIAAQWPEIQSSLDKADAATLDLRNAKQKIADAQVNALGWLARGVKAAGDTPDAFTAAVHHAVSNGTLTPDDVQPYLDAAQQNPAGISALTAHLISASPAASAQAEKETHDRALEDQAKATGARAEENIKLAQARLTETLRHNKAVEGNGIDADAPDAQGAIDALGQFMAQTGRMPVGFRVYGKNSAAFYTAVAAKADDYLKSHGGDLATNAAQYGANEGSLKKLQAQYDALQSFYDTADKNADLLKQQIAKIPDVGSPIFNRPIRAFAAGVQGDPNLSAFASYLMSVQNEYAKILTNPSLSGQLTDSARHEAQALVSPASSVKQIIASLDALKSEGRNRLDELQQQIQVVQGRIKGAAGGSDSAAPASISVTAPNGKTYTFKSQADANAFKKAAGIP